MQYDIASKVLIDRCRDDIIRYLLKIPVQESRILEPLPQETVSLKRGDYPIMITDESGGQEMAIIEIYAEWDKLIPLHLIDYRVRFQIQHGVEGRSCVILLRPSGSATDRYEDRELQFRFQLVKIYEMDARRVVSEGPLCMLPFVPLMKGGEAALDEAEELWCTAARKPGRKRPTCSPPWPSSPAWYRRNSPPDSSQGGKTS